MPENIKNYIPQDILKGSKKLAFKLWSIVLLFVFLWVLLIVSAPVAAANGINGFAEPLYNFYGYICHQIPERSFYALGHQFAVCSRCFGVYFGLLAGFLIYPLFRPLNETEPFPRFWLMLAGLPMLVDWSLTVFGIWENTFFTRTLTGLILGFACAVFIVPALAELAELILIKRFRRNNAKKAAS